MIWLSRFEHELAVIWGQLYEGPKGSTDHDHINYTDVGLNLFPDHKTS